MPQPATQQSYEQLAINLLKETLYSQGRYALDPQYKNSINNEEDEDSEQVQNLINQLTLQLEKLFNLDKEYENDRATQGWVTYLKDSLKSSPEYKTYTQKKTTIETQIESFKNQYIELSTKKTTENIAKQLNFNTDATIGITDLIFKQISYMEKNIKIYWSTRTYRNTNQNIAGQDKDLKEEYQTFLQDNKVIETLLSNIEGYQTLITNYPNKLEIKMLIEEYKKIYAEKIFFSVNEQLYQTTNTNNLNFFKDELKNTNIKESIFLQKFTLLCQYTMFDEEELKTERKLTPPTTTALDKIMRKINDLTPDQIFNFSKKANETFTTLIGPTARSRFLSPTQNEMFYNQLFFIEYQKFLNNIENTAKQDIKYIDKASQQLLENRIKALEDSTKLAIVKITEEASNNYTPQQPPSIQQLTGWTIEEPKLIKPTTAEQSANNNSSIYQAFADIQKQAIENANKIYMNIKGIEQLTQEETKKFIDKLTSLEEKSLIENAKQSNMTNLAQWVVSKFYTGTILPQQEAIKNEIKSAIHQKFATIKANKIARFKNEIYQTSQITSAKLQQDLEKDLEDAIINLKKLGSGIPPIPEFNQEEKDKDPEMVLKNREAYIVDKIEIAKLLSKIDTFNNVPTDQQKQFITKLYDILLTIKEKNKLLETLKSQSTQDSSKRNEVKKLNNDLGALKNQINEIIKQIGLYAPSFQSIKEELNIKNDSYSSIKPKSNNFFAWALTSLQASIATIAVGVFIYNIPIIGRLVQPLINTLSWFVNTLGVIGGVSAIIVTAGFIGNKLHIQDFLKPFTYLGREIYDIWQKENSYIDRFFRTAAILLPIAAGIVILGVTLANPVSGPALAAIVISGLAATFISSSVSAYAAKRISQAVCTRFYDIQDPDLYKPELALRFCNNNHEQATKLRSFFVENINKYQAKLNKIPAQEKESPQAQIIQNILKCLKENWKSITQNKDPESYAADANKLLEMLYANEKYEVVKQLQTDIEQSQGITNSLLEIIEIPKYLHSKEMDEQVKTSLFLLQQKPLVSFKPLADKLNQTIRAQPSEPLKILGEFNKIIMDSKNHQSHSTN